MGNIFSSEEKLQREKLFSRRNSRQIVGIYEHYGYNPIETSVSKQREHLYIKRRNLSFHGRNGRNYYYKSKSNSLNAILEELYSLGPDSDIQEERPQVSGSKIPRIKLKRSTSSLKEEKSYKALRKMSSETEIYFSDTTNLHKKVNNDEMENISKNTTRILINDQSYDEISQKSDENYFTKNFDDCMKRLELIEKEYKLIENVDSDKQFCKLSQERNIPDSSLPAAAENSPKKISDNYNSESEFNNFDRDTIKGKTFENPEENFQSEHQSLEKNDDMNVLKQYTVTTVTAKTAPSNEDEILQQQNNETISDWYSNLKQQFERKEQESQELKTKEMSCRITGATLKSQNETKKSEDKEKETRHYFSNLVKTNRSLIDEELPDPDKVKHIRAMFQETLNSTLKRKLDKKLGGSLQNISLRSAEQQLTRPLSAQCCRNELFGEMATTQRGVEKKDMETSAKEISKPLKDENKDFEAEDTKKKLFEKYELKSGREFRGRRMLQPKWTDTGSVSSGISSDLSSYDTDLESYTKEGTEQEEMTISDDDLLEEVKDKHYIQNEVLEKIRSYGTSVTYYGGEMITCSVGPLLSPTTQAIMEEIGEKYGHETNPARSFDEFYRKYIETNDHSRKKKLGRTRSFGQNDVFQKPNVLNNTEIELYKNDLEIEIGIKKPVGIPQNSLKRKVTKSASLGDEMKITEKTRELSPQVTISTTETNINNDSTTNEVSNRDSFSKENEIVSNNVTKDITSTTDSEETKGTEMITPNEPIQEKHDGNNTEETTEIKKPTPEKEYIRSKSAPEGLVSPKKYEKDCNTFESPAKEIYFSYEKSIFNGNRKSDMEFEEFEVCESLSEKLEKLEKQNSENGKIPNEANSSSQTSEPMEDLTKEEASLSAASADKNDTDNTGTSENQIPILEKNEKKELKFNHSRWPIETTVMVDIQKNDEQTPKIISNRKTVAKTKVRLF